MEKSIIKVEGMTCEHCVRAVTNAITELLGIGEITVDLDAGLVTVEHDSGVTSVSKIEEVIIEEGYEVVK